MDIFSQLSASNSFPEISQGGLYEELWQACAGSLVYVPKENESVWYFPQGHMEQVAASTQQRGCQQLPNSGLASKILCHVVNLVLNAEAETDEVYAQISLLPQLHGALDTSEKSNTEDATPPQPKSSTRQFIKILTASDTSTHGGFSVLRKHAEECLPPLDMTQEVPTQNLVAKDLHGRVWNFRHTYRGHPRRHLLTTGWSVFVSQKKLSAGDAVIFLRGENNELRVGIRRARRQQTSPQAVMSSQSMHMGVVATASHASGTRTMFTVFFKPRMSLSAFLVPLQKFSKSLSVSLSVGMRFKMHFETEDASDRSFTGTITAIEDMDGVNWADSQWRSLKVNWDELNNDRPDRVSPWEIEPCMALQNVNQPVPTVRTKRQRPPPNYSLISELSGPGSNLYGTNVLQGQETGDMGISSWRGPRHGNSLVQDMPHLHHHVHVQQQKHHLVEGVSGSSSIQFSNNRISFYPPFASPPGIEKRSSVASSSIYGERDYGLNRTHTWPALSDDISPNWHPSPHPPWATSIQEEVTNAPGFGNPPVTQQTSECLASLYPNVPSFPLEDSREQDTFVTKPSVCAPPTSLPRAGESTFRIFGVSLLGKPNLTSPKSQDVANVLNEGEASRHEQQQHLHGQVIETELPKLTVKSEAISEQEKLDYNVVEAHSTLSARSCIKVIKKGSKVGRGIDLTRFEGYDGLLKELESMFNMKGELTNPERGWQVAYSDREGDTMKVGDDPWPEFCVMVTKLYILSPEEMHGAA